jgi:hypothetical protein
LRRVSLHCKLQSLRGGSRESCACHNCTEEKYSGSHAAYRNRPPMKARRKNRCVVECPKWRPIQLPESGLRRWASCSRGLPRRAATMDLRGKSLTPIFPSMTPAQQPAAALSRPSRSSLDVTSSRFCFLPNGQSLRLLDRHRIGRGSPARGA